MKVDQAFTPHRHEQEHFIVADLSSAKTAQSFAAHTGTAATRRLRCVMWLISTPLITDEVWLIQHNNSTALSRFSGRQIMLNLSWNSKAQNTSRLRSIIINLYTDRESSIPSSLLTSPHASRNSRHVTPPMKCRTLLPTCLKKHGNSMPLHYHVWRRAAR